MSNQFTVSIDREIYSIESLLRVLNGLKVSKMEGSIVKRKIRGYYRLYLSKKGCKQKYINKASMPTAIKINQYKYNQRMKILLESRLRDLKKLRKKYDIDIFEEAYKEYSAENCIPIKPIQLTDEMYLKQWKKDHATVEFGDEKTYETNAGFLVRSKSEKIIADALTKAGITYVYESVIELANADIVYPDFCILDLKNRRTIIWEHFGLMNDESYAEKTYKKISKYVESGFIRGKTLIYSSEGDGTKLDLQIKNNIKWLLEGGFWENQPIVW